MVLAGGVTDIDAVPGFIVTVLNHLYSTGCATLSQLQREQRHKHTVVGPGTISFAGTC